MPDFVLFIVTIIFVMLTVATWKDGGWLFVIPTILLGLWFANYLQCESKVKDVRYAAVETSKDGKFQYAIFDDGGYIQVTNYFNVIASHNAKLKKTIYSAGPYCGVYSFGIRSKYELEEN